MVQKRLLVFRQHGGDSIPLIKFGHGNSHGRTDTSQSDNTGRSRSAKEVAYVICGIIHFLCQFVVAPPALSAQFFNPIQFITTTKTKFTIPRGYCTPGTV